MSSKLVYISGPYSSSTKLGVEANVTVAREAALWCVEHRIFYFCPHLNSLFFEQWKPEVPTSFYYAMDEEILSRCDGMLILPNWDKSKGVIAEIEYCRTHHIRMFVYPEGLHAVLSWHREEKP